MLEVFTRQVEQIRLESMVPATIFDRTKEFREQGYKFEPIRHYMNGEDQTVYYAIGSKQDEWRK